MGLGILVQTTGTEMWRNHIKLLFIKFQCDLLEMWTCLSNNMMSIQCSDKTMWQLLWQSVNKRPSHIQYNCFFRLAVPLRKNIFVFLLLNCQGGKKAGRFARPFQACPDTKAWVFTLWDIVITHQETPNPWMWSDVLWPPCDVILGTLKLTFPAMTSPDKKETEV